MVPLAQGDLAGARAVDPRGPARPSSPAALLAFFGNYQDLYWVLDDAQQQQLLALPPSAFDDDRGDLGHRARRRPISCGSDPAQARVYADSARLAFEEQLRATPEDGQRHVLRAWPWPTWAGRRRRSQEGERGVALLPVSRDAFAGCLHPAPARPDLPARGRAGEGARPARAAAQDPVLPLARLAQDRSHLRPAPGQPALRTIDRRRIVCNSPRVAPAEPKPGSRFEVCRQTSTSE